MSEPPINPEDEQKKKDEEQKKKEEEMKKKKEEEDEEQKKKEEDEVQEAKQGDKAKMQEEAPKFDLEEEAGRIITARSHQFLYFIQRKYKSSQSFFVRSTDLFENTLIRVGNPLSGKKLFSKSGTPPVQKFFAMLVGLAGSIYKVADELKKYKKKKSDEKKEKVRSKEKLKSRKVKAEREREGRAVRDEMCRDISVLKVEVQDLKKWKISVSASRRRPLAWITSNSSTLIKHELQMGKIIREHNSFIRRL